jgi:hypothetical protein
VRCLTAQNILIRDSKAYDKTKRAIELVQKYEPDLFHSIVKTSVIQLGSRTADNSLEAAGFAILDERRDFNIPWIMLSPEFIKICSVKELSSVIVHEACHLRSMRIAKSQGSVYVSTGHEAYLEHVEIYNYVLSYLGRIKSSEWEKEQCRVAMKLLNIPIKD